MTKEELNSLKPGDKITWFNCKAHDGERVIKFTYIAPGNWICDRGPTEKCCKFSDKNYTHPFSTMVLLNENILLVKDEIILLETPIKNTSRLGNIDYD